MFAVGETGKLVLVVFAAALLLVAGVNQLQKLYAPSAGQPTPSLSGSIASPTPSLSGSITPDSFPNLLAAGVDGIFPVLATGVDGDASGGLVAERRTMSVSGEGKITSAPDEVKIHARVETENPKAFEAQQQNAEIIARVRAALTGLGVGEDKIESTSFSVYPKYRYTGSESILTGYKATHSLEINLGNRIDDAGKVIDAVGGAGALISGIQFGLSPEKQVELKKQALAMAGKDVLEQANVLAGSLNVRVKQLLTASVGATYTPYPRYRDYAVSAGAEAAPTQISPGELTVTASVSAVFEIE